MMKSRWYTYLVQIQFVIARVQDLRAQDREGKLDNLEKVPLLHRLLHYRYPNEELMPDRDIISEAIGQLYAYLFPFGRQ